VHTASGFLLLINAFLGFFYYVTTGEIRQLIPRVRGLFSDMSAQARYYLGGILRGEEHPFHRRPEARLNPLQRLTYLGLLNVLLPLQIGTGVLIRSAEEWGAVDGFFGGLRVLALLHTIGAWLLTAFLLAHLYLITTGRSPGEHLKSMVSGLGEAHSDPRKEQGP
jgi:thiosulfate reductase cytochrome b subunit